MALVASALASKMLDATEMATDGALAMSKLGIAISEYVIANAVINFSFTGVSPAPATITTPATGKFTNMVIQLTQVAGGFPQFNLLLGTGIMTGIYLPDSPFSCSPGSMIGFPITTVGYSGETDRKVMYNNMAKTIVSDITKFVPTVPCAGTYGAFVGTCTPTGII